MIGAHHSSAASSGWLVIVARWLAALIVLGLLFHFLPFAPLRAAPARSSISPLARSATPADSSARFFFLPSSGVTWCGLRSVCGAVRVPPPFSRAILPIAFL